MRLGADLCECMSPCVSWLTEAKLDRSSVTASRGRTRLATRSLNGNMGDGEERARLVVLRRERESEGGSWLRIVLEDALFQDPHMGKKLAKSAATTDTSVPVWVLRCHFTYPIN